ncbi:MAG: hypothetical protein Q8P37_00600 [Candidatus Spechtbacteria bacterium]|nr:hypothetical protein [Candidatus Spechtbacteria bacterium]
MLAISYITWHYTTAVLKILSLARNFFKAVWHKFFIGRHLLTFLATWHRLNAKYVFQNENVGDKIANFIVDIFIRFLAAGMRSVVISIGLLAEAVVLVSFGFILAAWVSWPVVFFMMITRGVALMLY